MNAKEPTVYVVINWTDKEEGAVFADEREAREFCADTNGEMLSQCECDNTHEKNGTVCQYCWWLRCSPKGALTRARVRP